MGGSRPKEKKLNNKEGSGAHAPLPSYEKMSLDKVSGPVTVLQFDTTNGTADFRWSYNHRPRGKEGESGDDDVVVELLGCNFFHKEC
jgi:hypothetical protein